MNSRAQMLIARGGLIIELGCGWAPLTSPAATQSLRMVSARDVFQPAATGGDSDSLAPVVSVDGRYILFASTARNLISLSSNAIPLPAIMAPKLNVFLRDRTNQSTVLVSINAGGSGGGNGDSVPVALSTNGQFVLFESSASDLVTGDTNRLSDIYLRDLQNNSTLLVSLNTNGMAGNGFSIDATMSPDGRYVAFMSTATDLVAGDTNGVTDVFVRDMQTGLTMLASPGARSAGMNPKIGNIGSEAPDISANGRFVAFYSSASNLVSDASISIVGNTASLQDNSATGATRYYRIVGF